MPPAPRTLRAEILSQGDEVVTGQIADTNAAWLADRLTLLGFQVTRHSAVGDRLDDIVTLLRERAACADVLLCTGGLGPTEDDLTAEAVVAAFGGELAFDEVAWAQIQAIFARYRRPLPEINRKQAWLPAGGQRLDNDRGTAPGFAVHTGVPGASAWLACMPGVPHEMMAMFAAHVEPVLRGMATRPGRLVTLRTTGVGESALQERITADGPFIEPGFILGFRTMPGENQVKLRVDADVPDGRVRAVVDGLRRRIGSPVFAVEGIDGVDGLGPGSLVAVIARALTARGETLAVAESCTGGRVAAMCTELPGSSAWFLSGVVAYANAAKVHHLGVDPALLAAHGAVSEPVARAMAEGARAAAGSTYGLATTGVAGPDGGSDDKPVGTVHLAVATPTGTVHHLARLGGDRARIQTYATHAALDLLRRHL